MLVTVDTGGTKTLVANFEHDGTVGKIIKFATPKDTHEYIALLKQTIQQNYDVKDIEALIVAMPGIVKDGIAIWCNHLQWTNFDIRPAFKDILGETPILVENDANLAGLAETRVLDPMPVSSLYVTISTGIGTGITTNGHIDPGLRLSEGGLMQVEFKGKVLQWEDFASGYSIKEVYGAYAKDITDEKSWTDIADRISRGFLACIPLLQPEVIIIGGSIGTYFTRYSQKLEHILQKKLPSHISCPRFEQARHPEQAVIYGCYYYALDSLTH